MSSSGDGPEETGSEVNAADAGELGMPDGAGQVSPAVLDEEPGFLSREPNRHGRARAMTTFSPVRPWYRPHWPPGGALWLNLVFWFTRTFRCDPGTIEELSFIHFARWIVIRRLPDHGQPSERLRHPLLMFESNYNGTFDQYIDAFSNILTNGMTTIWGSSYGFPGPQPVAPFKSYISANEFVADHYYSAYPDASTTMIKSALALKKPLQALTERAAKVKPAKFREKYRQFLIAMQDHL